MRYLIWLIIAATCAFGIYLTFWAHGANAQELKWQTLEIKHETENGYKVMCFTKDQLAAVAKMFGYGWMVTPTDFTIYGKDGTGSGLKDDTRIVLTFTSDGCVDSGKIIR